ncbi:hypothetical protein D3C71_1706800 [compost metagenome]
MPLSSSTVAMTAEPLIWKSPYTAAAVPARSANGSSAKLRPDPSASEKPTVSTATGSMKIHADKGAHHHAAACMADASSSAAMPTRTMVWRP